MNGSNLKPWLVRASLLALTTSIGACSVGNATVSVATPAVPVATPAATTSATPSVSAALSVEPNPSEIAINAYFVMVGVVEDSPTPLVAVHRAVPRTAAVATAAMEQLLSGPTFEERAHDLRLGTIGTLIPEGTRLLGIAIENGIASVDLSGEFVSGAALGEDVARAWAWRLAQVTYTLTQFPTVQSVSFKVDGKPTVAIEGHEGAPIERATRSAYFDQLPAIFVDEPAWGAAITDSLTVSGIAQIGALEPQFEAALVDPATDEIIVQQKVRPACGEGCWQPPGGGGFEIQFSIPAGADRDGLLLRLWEVAPDGSVIDFREYPLR
jgi:spore germination protein GerM